MKHLIAFLAFVMCAQVQAQTAQQTTVVAPQAAPAQAKRTVIYDERTNQLVEVSPQIHTTSEASAAAPIYILNGGAQAQVQEQPTMVVQDSPLNASPAEGVRKQRQEAETQTEDGIVQTLEKARMDDELKRREKFNAALQPTPTPAPTPAPAPVAVVPVVAPVQQVVAPPMAAPQAVIESPREEKREEKDNTDLKAEIRAAIAEASPAKEAAPKEQYSVGALFGIGTYPGVQNMKGNGSAGFSVAMTSVDRWVGEGSFLYGNYKLENIYMNDYDAFGNPVAYLVDMNQMNIAVAAKYQLLGGKLRPAVGPAASYTRRSYVKDGQNLKTSNAVDVGIASSIDLALSAGFSIGFDLKYYWNLTSSSDQHESIYWSDHHNPEDLSYYQAGISAKLLF
jgi:hypothetical protein